MSADNTAPKQSLWTPGRIIATVVVVALIATIGYTLFSGAHEETAQSKTILPGAPAAPTAPVNAPSDFSLPTLEGNTIKISNYRGKVLVLDFWATWCPPCRQEIPQLVRLANQNRERGLEVIGLHIDDRGRSSPDDIRKFIDQYDINYTVAMASDDVFEAYLGREETAIPQTLVFDRSGRLVVHLVGYDSSHARKLDEAVNRALAGS